MLHGHTKIELTNVKTGERKTIEHDNYMTNWLRDVLTPDIYGNNIMAVQTFAGRQNIEKAFLFGGVILFEEPLSNNDADDYSFPQNNKMIAHGCDEVYAGSDLTMGSFNSGLSVIGDDEATFIWDFTQERGNGTISALGLTNAIGGKAGSGHGKNIADINASITVMSRIIWEASTGASYRYLFFDEANNKAYFVKPTLTQGYKIVYRECAYNCTEYNPIKDTLSWDRLGIYQNGEDIEIDVSQYFNDFPAVTIENGKLYMCSSANWTGGSRQFLIYDFQTKTLSTANYTNQTGKTLVAYLATESGQYPTSHAFEIWNNRLYFNSTDGRRVYIDMTDNTDCGIVKNPDNEEIQSSGEFCKLWDELIFSDSGSVTGATNQLWVMTNKDHASRRNINGLTVQNNLSAPCFGGNKARAYYFTVNSYYTESSPRLMFNMMALQTKNNLDSPVTKTSDMTMRVTYTIREAT